MLIASCLYLLGSTIATWVLLGPVDLPERSAMLWGYLVGLLAALFGYESLLRLTGLDILPHCVCSARAFLPGAAARRYICSNCGCDLQVTDVAQCELEANGKRVAVLHLNFPGFLNSWRVQPIEALPAESSTNT